MSQRPLTLMTVVLLAILLPACTGTTSRAAREELLAVDAKFAALVEEKGLSVYEDYFAEDAVSLPAFEPMVEGKAAIIETYRPYYNSSKFRLRWKPTRAEVSEDNRFGFTIGHYEVTYVNDQGVSVTRIGKYVTVWRKDWDGRWKVVVDGGSPDEHPLPASPQESPAQPGAAQPGAAPPVAPRP
jgi:ketosteroid isomerase-like protein